MINQLKNSAYLKQSVLSFGGQLAFLLANFLLFVLLVNKITQDQFGAWALYITIISIADSLRQGMVQNGLARLLIKFPNDKSLSTTGFVLNYALIILLGGLILIGAWLFSASTDVNQLLPHAWKSLLVLGSIQFMSTLCQARLAFKTYFITNAIYMVCFVACIAYVAQTSAQISLVQIINAQALSLILPSVYFIWKRKASFAKLSKAHFIALFQFGRYSAGTNLLSILFHKADILMIAFFLDPMSVALFHFASKIMNYAELPLHALSQVIYPRLSASYHSDGASALNKEYGISIIRLSILVIPIALIVVIFNKDIIGILSSGEYIEASQLIIILAIGIVFKPWGRVFGLTLDAIGRPKVNFRMLLLSLIINITMNLLLIPSLGVQGAALATTSSILLTTLIGQFRIGRYTPISPLKDVWQAMSMQRGYLKSLSWN